jgi:hypothetical protein
MKQLLVAMAMLFTALTMQSQSNVHSRFIQQGIFGQATISIERGNITLQVQSGTDPNSPDGQGIATVLFYTLFQFGADGNSSTFTQVFAHIPNGSFTGQNTQRMILDVDTSQFDPNDSIISTCTANFLPVVTIVCSDTAPAGTIHLEFQENGLQRGRLLALEQETTLGPLTVRERANGDSSSANIKGSFLGFPVVEIDASVGRNRDTSWSITKNPL